MLDVRITFYKINKFGFYKRNKNNRSFGEISEILNNIHDFYKDKELKYTCPYLVNKDDSVMRTFLFDLKKHTSGSFMLTTWNETPTHNGSIASVPASNKVGTLSVDLTNPPDDSIPGYPTYFWFLPEQELYATIVLGNAVLNGNQGVGKFMKRFMEKFSHFTVKQALEGSDAPIGETNFGFEVTGYKSRDDDYGNYYPHFETSLYQNPGQLEYIKSKRTSIQKVVRRSGVDCSLETQRESGFFRGILNDILGKDKRSDDDDNFYKVDYEISLKPTIKELDYIIDSGSESTGTGGRKEDRVGFKISGENGIWWVDSSLARDDFEMDISEFQEGFPRTTSLLNKLEASREHILKQTGVTCSG